MKKNIKYLFLIISSILYSQYTAIPDANFEEALISIGYDDVLDGQVLTSNIINVESINLSSREIVSLTGIEDFIALKTLWIKNNFIETIDISNLQSLEWIWCSNNDLTSLNVSGLSSLEAIWASDNSISTIDFTGLDVLNDVMLSNNLLSSIDVSFLQNIELLDVTNNLLTEIDVSNLSILKELKVGFNDITELDCSLTEAYLIHCDNNLNLSSINVQNNVISDSDPDLLWYGFLFSNLPNLEFICMDSGEEQALSYSGYDAEIVNVATGPNCTFANEDFVASDFNIFPNPVKEILNIDNSINAEIRSIRIYDLLGKVVLEEREINNQLDVSHLLRGIFYVKIETDKGVLTKKLIKE